MNNISENLKNLRKENGWTQQELADKLFVTRQAISNWELGKTEPDADMLIKISEITQTNIADIVSAKSEQATSTTKRTIDMVFVMYVLLLIIFMIAKNICIYATETINYSGVVTDTIRIRLDIAETLRNLTLPWYIVSLGLVNFLLGAIAMRIIKFNFKNKKFSKIKFIIHILCLVIIFLHCTTYFTELCLSDTMHYLNSILETITAPFKSVRGMLYSATVLPQYRWQFIPFGVIYEYTRQTKTEC